MDPSREERFTIPKVLLESFAKEARIVLKPLPGLWPVDMKLLRSGMLEKLAADKAFQRDFEILIVHKR